MLRLKGVLHSLLIKQSDLATAIGVSDAGIAQIINHNDWPKLKKMDELKATILAFLAEHGAAVAQTQYVFDVEPTPEAFAGIRVNNDQIQNARIHHSKTALNEDDVMLLRKQTLHQATRKHFGLFRDPFADEAVQSHEDMYISPDVRYVREAMFQTAKHGGMMAVVAESGAGKTTLMRDLQDRILRENLPIMIIRPYVLAMEGNDRSGKTLKASDIVEAIKSAVAPLQRNRVNPEARFKQLHTALCDSHQAGYSHCLIIDEAHSLPIATLKHLKRFFELEMGFKKLLSIILVGQPELKAKLSERNSEVREVVQRCEVVELLPLDGARLDDYLKFKFQRMNKPVAEVIDASGIEALRAKLTMASNRTGRNESVSLLYPLAVGNLLTACMNLAASVGAPVVTADVVKGV
ncbi:ExeA family protein [Iodobacter arcticus]|uniref:ExeA family protein n=1 Tax=Iodobacter arcticus TaxID=590593 RepID=A0ABW2QWQ0_9NEIS